MNVAATDPGGAEYLDLRKKARAEGRPLDELLTLYALEGLLGRLADSPDSERFILKGGVLLAAFGDRRPTRDADLLAQQMSNDLEQVTRRIARIAARPRHDGLVLNRGGTRSQLIRDEDEYSGVRVHLTYNLARAHIHIGVDVNVGDPIFPEPQQVELPGLLPDGAPVVLRGYRLVSVIAEKAVTGMQRGVANTRWRDYADLWTLTRRHPFNADDVVQACRIVAAHRQVVLSPLADLITDGYPAVAQAKWLRWMSGQSHNPSLPSDFSAVLAAAAAFVDPALLGQVPGHTWDPDARLWLP